MGSCGTANNDKSASVELNNGDIESKPTGILDYCCCNCSKKPNYLVGSVGLDVHNNYNNNGNNKTIITKIYNEGSDGDSSSSSSEENYNFLTQSEIKNHNDKFKNPNKGTKKTEPFIKNKSIFVYGEEGIIN